MQRIDIFIQRIDTLECFIVSLAPDSDRQLPTPFSQSITMGELYGEVNKLTMEWKDGLMAMTVRQCVQVPSSSSSFHVPYCFRLCPSSGQPSSDRMGSARLRPPSKTVMLKSFFVSFNDRNLSFTIQLRVSAYHLEVSGAFQETAKFNF